MVQDTKQPISLFTSTVVISVWISKALVDLFEVILNPVGELIHDVFMGLKLVLGLAFLFLVTHAHIAQSTGPLPAKHLNPMWNMSIKSIKTVLDLIIPWGFRLHVSFAGMGM